MKSRRLLPSVVDPDRYPYDFGLPDPDPFSKRFGSGSFYHQAKIGRKNLISTVLYDFLFLKNDVNVPAKKLFVGILKVTDENSRI